MSPVKRFFKKKLKITKKEANKSNEIIIIKKQIEKKRKKKTYFSIQKLTKIFA